MKIVITGSLGNISKPLVKSLLASGHEITVISSSPDRKAAIEALGATAAIGSVDNEEFLASTFKGADAVYTMVPPTITATDFTGYARGTGAAYAQAIRSAGVKRVVNLSSIGAHLKKGTGPIAGIHEVEEIFAGLHDVDVKHLRAGFFYTNFYNDLPMIKGMKIMGSNYSADSRLVMVHPRDIAAAVAEELTNGFTGKSVRYVISDERKVSEIVRQIGDAIGQPSLPWVEFTDEQSAEGMQRAGLPEPFAVTYTELGSAVRKGILWTDYDKNKPAVFGKTKLEDFVKEFAEVFGK